METRAPFPAPMIDLLKSRGVHKTRGAAQRLCWSESVYFVVADTRYQFYRFLSVSQILTGAGTNQVPLALSTTLLVSHRRKSVYADVLLHSCRRVLSLLDSSS
jgi:hypothetical protein